MNSDLEKTTLQVNDPTPAPAKSPVTCAHCGAVAQHNVYSAYVDKFEDPVALKQRVDNERLYRISLSLSEESLNVENFAAKYNASNLLIVPSPLSKHVYTVSNLFFSQCLVCFKLTLWFNDKIIYPAYRKIYRNPDMSEEVGKIFDEANSILELSPRAAISILRLAVEKQLEELGVKNTNLDEAINELQNRGGDIKIIKALHAVRLIGNSNIHPRKFGFENHLLVAQNLFNLVNKLVEYTSINESHLEDVLIRLPEPLKKQIENKFVTMLTDTSKSNE